MSLLTATNSEILKDLGVISRNIDNYPESKRKLNPQTKCYDTYKEDISVNDCFSLIYTVHSRMEKFITSHSQELYNNEDYQILYSTILEIYKSDNKDEKDKLLEQFDKHFSFLLETQNYSDIYLKHREKYLSSLLTKIRLLENIRINANTPPAHKNLQAYLEYKKEMKVEYDRKRWAEGRIR